MYFLECYLPNAPGLCAVELLQKLHDPGEITATIDIGSNRIIILENENEQGCDCLCLFDVQYRITNLPPEQYTIQIIGPYLNGSDEPIEVEVDFRDTSSGIFCFNRDHYPWS